MLGRLGDWFSDPTRWSGSAGIPARVLEHLGYTALAVAIAAVIALPLGALIGHTRRGGLAVVGVANGLRALPELGVLVLFVLLLGLGLLPPTLALVLLAIPPLLAGAYSGVAGADPGAVDAARGIGMREHQVLLQVEVPAAVPLVLGGLRFATLQVIATATIAAYVGLGGLGRFIIDGFSVRDFPQMLGGAVIVAVLSIVVEFVLQGLGRLVTPGPDRLRLRRHADGPPAPPVSPSPAPSSREVRP
ncbi:ABC transporter permease [Actinomycetospora lemnae]|uniref:ABC transporter permease n=1 Tax=Actinomycetospora lemnae TaxID=3019891 RepID=A0ABT5SLM1_9PSEU|nr:ABC transporter permease [Actinomycetospora sp. DW7H6]MDD7963727.1 ABC transporter permease [Actinomycetospora sp. DW7H6]